MTYLARLLLSVMITGLLVFSAACPNNRTNIGNIESNPSRFDNRDVAIAGTVRDSFGVSLPGTSVGGGVYQINDGTGSIWVIAERGVPSKNVQVGVRGTVRRGVTWGGRNYGLAIFERERRYKNR